MMGSNSFKQSLCSHLDFGKPRLIIIIFTPPFFAWILQHCANNTDIRICFLVIRRGYGFRKVVGVSY